MDIYLVSTSTRYGLALLTLPRSQSAAAARTEKRNFNNKNFHAIFYLTLPLPLPLMLMLPRVTSILYYIRSYTMDFCTSKHYFVFFNRIVIMCVSACAVWWCALSENVILVHLNCIFRRRKGKNVCSVQQAFN